MCVALPVIGAIIAGAGLVTNLIGQKQTRQSNQNYLNYLASSAEAEIPEVLATGKRTRRYITERAARKSASADVKSRQLLGSQKVAAAASGLGGGSVTVSQLAMDEVSKSILDNTYIRYEADIAKYEQTQEERAVIKGTRRKAKAYRMGAQASESGAALSTVGSLLSGASQVASMWYRN